VSPLYRRIGSYEILSEIGAGGMADVYKAEDARTGRTVALKVPRQDPAVRRAERDGALLQQHLAERDARVAQVYETGEDDGVPFVAMEYVAGEDLSERIACGPLEPAEAIRIAIELCDLLAVAHACTPAIEGRPRRGIVHGDLKPRNVRLEADGRVRVVDFGIAKALSETRRLTHNEFGSLAYSSPERIDTGTVDDQADLWAVAVVLYEMLTGTPPFHAATPRELERILLGRTRPAPLPERSPRALDAMLQKAFAPRLEQRYRSATAFKADLERAAAGAETVAEGERAAAGHEGASAPAPAAGPWDQAAESTRRTEGPGETRRSDGAETATVAPEEVTRRASPADATRRSEAEVTRRTVVAAPASNGSAAAPPATSASAAATPAPPAPTGTAPAPAAMPPDLRRAIVIAKRVVLVVAAAAIVNEISVARAGGDLRARVGSYRRSEANQVWHQYRQLRRRSVLGFGTWGVNGRIRDWHVAAADELTDDYLSDTPTIRERGWQQAIALLQRAAAIDPGNGAVRARLRYCEAQLARIDGEALLERQQEAAARARFNESRRLFDEATHLRGHWPDPHLGIARVHAVAFADVERTEEALRRAERAGYQPGDRETALRADAHRLRAERMLAAVPGLPEEQRYLDRIRDDCWRALELYDQVPAYAQVNRSMRRVHTLLERLDARERALAPAPVPPTEPEAAAPAGG
jgi:predicted Ser/Thr protein kinase